MVQIAHTVPGPRGAKVVQGPSHSSRRQGLRCQVTAVAAGAWKEQAPPFFLSPSLSRATIYCSLGACSRFGRYAQLGILHLILNP